MGGKLQYVPWALALATGVWFALMARKADRSLVQWALTGLVFGLVVGTIVLGLGQATGIPYSDHERTAMHVKWTAAAAAIIAVFGWVITMGLHRQHLALWNRAAKSPSPEPGPAAGAGRSRVDPPKPSANRV
jgi:hypothetical protein